MRVRRLLRFLLAGMLVSVACAESEFTPTNEELERRDQPVTSEDLLILQRAVQLLGTEAAWNRMDDRECDDDEAMGTRSLFCALERASLDILGEYRHRDVVLQEVRFAVEDATKGLEFEHRLMDYNNLESTTFEDIRQVLMVATDRVRARLAAQEARKWPRPQRAIPLNLFR